MLVFKILVVLAILAAVGCVLLSIHNFRMSLEIVKSMKDWAYEVDRQINQYIQEQFVLLKEGKEIASSDDSVSDDVVDMSSSME